MKNLYCWICGDKANTREHIFKKSIIKNNLEDHPYHIPLDGRKTKRINGAGSKRFKYKPSLCAKCNNDRSSEWDKAYSLFVEDYCFKYDEDDEIDFTKIYGSNYNNGIRNLHCYFIKSLGCRIRDKEADLPDNFPNLLSSENLSTLKISIHKNPFPFFLCILKENPEKKLLDNIALGKGALFTLPLKNTSTTNYKVHQAIWWENIGNYQVNYWLNIEADLRFGVPIEYNIPRYKTPQHKLDVREIEDCMWKILSKTSS